MTRTLQTLFLAFSLLLSAPAMAQDFSVTSDMQRCTTQADCALISNDCAKPCGFVSVNKGAIPALQKAFSLTCDKRLDQVLPCAPSTLECVQGLCVVAAIQTTAPVAPAPAPAPASASAAPAPTTAPAPVAAPVAPTAPTAPTVPAADYKAGAYNVSEPATESKVKGDYSRVNDRDGKFSAYNLPQGEVKQKEVGTIVDRIYVPADAPVSGGKYVPVTQAPKAPAVPAPAPAPVAVPTQMPVAAPAVPATPVAPAPVMQPAAPAPLSNVPSMTPTRESAVVSGQAAPIAQPQPVYPAPSAPVAEPTPIYPAPEAQAAPQPPAPDAIPSEFTRAMNTPEGGAVYPVDANLTPEPEAPSKALEPQMPATTKSFTVKTEKKNSSWNLN